MTAASKQIQQLNITFNTRIRENELSAFRGAVVNKVGRKFEWFHNHDNQKGGFHHRYPRIQYKLHRGKPMIVCLEEGIEEIYEFFGQPSWNLKIKDKDVPIVVKNLDMTSSILEMSPTPKSYRIKNWLAFNDKNQKEYDKLPSLMEKIAFIERVLMNHILSFTKDMGWLPPERFKLKVTNLHEIKKIKFKNRFTKLCLTLDFDVTLNLPSFIGVGKASSTGYGMIIPNLSKA